MNRKKLPPKEIVFQAVMILLFTLLFLSCVYPFYYIFIASISDPDAVQKSMISWYPLEPTLKNYAQVFELNGIFNAFLVSIARTVVGTIVTLFFYQHSGLYPDKAGAALQEAVLLHCHRFHVYQRRADPLVSDHEDHRTAG